MSKSTTIKLGNKDFKFDTEDTSNNTTTMKSLSGQIKEAKDINTTELTKLVEMVKKMLSQFNEIKEENAKLKKELADMKVDREKTTSALKQTVEYFERFVDNTKKTIDDAKSVLGKRKEPETHSSNSTARPIKKQTGSNSNKECYYELWLKNKQAVQEVTNIIKVLPPDVLLLKFKVHLNIVSKSSLLKEIRSSKKLHELHCYYRRVTHKLTMAITCSDNPNERRLQFNPTDEDKKENRCREITREDAAFIIKFMFVRKITAVMKLLFKDVFEKKYPNSVMTNMEIPVPDKRYEQDVVYMELYKLVKTVFFKPHHYFKSKYIVNSPARTIVNALLTESYTMEDLQENYTSYVAKKIGETLVDNFLK